MEVLSERSSIRGLESLSSRGLLNGEEMVGTEEGQHAGEVDAEDKGVDMEEENMPGYPMEVGIERVGTTPCTVNGITVDIIMGFMTGIG